MDLSSFKNPKSFAQLKQQSGQICYIIKHKMLIASDTIKAPLIKKIVTIYVIQCQNCQTDPKEKPTHIIYKKKSSHNIHTRGTLSKLSPPHT